VVRGELDMASSPRLGIAITEVLRTGPEALVIDICDVEFVDSTGLGVMLEARRRCRRQGAALRIACDVETTLRLLQLTRLDRDFDIYASREDALHVPAQA
jgi:anti-sigma B factor antagonist